MPYEAIGVQYKDFSFDDYFAWLGNAIIWLDAGKDGFRLILQDVNQCVDTTNFVDMKLTGPIIKVDGLKPSYCINDIISIKDVSEAPFGTKIAERSWQLGFQNEPNYSEIGDQREFVRKLTEAGRAYISIVAKDEDGCESGDVFTFEVVGPKSRFKASAEIVAIGTEVNFVNLSDYSNVADAIPTWMMPDGTLSNRVNESYTFNEEGEFFVKLFHQTPGSACRDTMVVRILVRSVNAQFTHSIAYLNNNGCPPALVTFTSTASNAVRYGWNFGNGATAGNQTNVSHTYNQPGVYTVWHYTWDENNNVDSTFDIIEIEGPYALISANRMFSCNDLEVTLNADVKNATSFTWDFGDGTLSSTAATTLNHRYLTAGIYTPSLVLEDDEGCQATSQLAQPLIVDSLRADFSYLPTGICAGGQVQFASASRSFSSTRLGTPMQYQWSINGNNLTPGNDSTLAHAFAGEGSYTVRLQVQTDYGCSASATKTLTVQPPLQAVAAGPTSLCIGDSATFTASSVGANVQYRWYLPGRNMITGNTTPRLCHAANRQFYRMACRIQ
jgi:PKD repeat protein